MRFSLAWMFALTTYVAILIAGVAIAWSWPPALWIMAMVAILVSHIHRWRGPELP